MDKRNACERDINYGQRHLLTIIEQRARETPDKVLLSLAKTTNIQDGFQDISYGRFNQAVDRCALWIESVVGREDGREPNPVFASLPRHDVRGALLNLAAPKTGHQMYWSQPFGTADEILESLRHMQCKTFFRPSHCPQVVVDIVAQRPMQVFDIPQLDQWLHATYNSQVPVYEYERKLIPQNPWAVCQTSGTTGLPKSIVLRNGHTATMDCFQLLPKIGEKPCLYSHMIGKRILSTFGWYQYAGLLFSMILAVYYDFVSVMAPKLDDWTADDVDTVHVYGNVQAGFLYPSLFVEIAKDERKLEHLAHLDFLVFAGSFIPLWVGDAIVRYTSLGAVFGSTEAGGFPMELPRVREEWSYFRPLPQLGYEYRPYLGKYHQMVVVRQRHLEPWQAVFFNFPELSEWETGDLLIQHPSQPQLWRPAGRIVDLLTLADGRRFNPVPIEGGIGEDAAIDMAMICGQCDQYLVILLNPSTRVEGDSRSFVDQVWPTIEHVTEIEEPILKPMLHKDYIHVASPEKPILRTGGKWNVNRKKTMASHQHNLEAIHGKLTTGLNPKRRL